MMCMLTNAGLHNNLSDMLTFSLCMFVYVFSIQCCLLRLKKDDVQQVCHVQQVVVIFFCESLQTSSYCIVLGKAN